MQRFWEHFSLETMIQREETIKIHKIGAGFSADANDQSM